MMMLCRLSCLALIVAVAGAPLERRNKRRLLLQGGPSHDDREHIKDKGKKVVHDAANKVIDSGNKFDDHVQKVVGADGIIHGTKKSEEHAPCEAGKSVAVLLMASVILCPLFFYASKTKMAHGEVAKLTMKMMDLSLSIFLAVLWFSATNEVLDTDVVHDMFPYSEEVFSILQVFILYTLAMFIAYTFRENKYYLLTFCGCAGHYIAFAGIKATGESQHEFGDVVTTRNSHWASMGFCLVVFGILASISVLCFYAWRRHVTNDELQKAVEDLELDIVGLVLSFAIMQALRHLLTGEYPSKAHLFLQDVSEPLGSYPGAYSPISYLEGGPSKVPHTRAQRTFMLLWSIGLTIFACLMLKKMEELKEECDYFLDKAIHVLQVVLVMCVAWGYLLWGEWQFYESYFKGDVMFGKLVFAILATCCSMLVIVMLAFACDRIAFERRVPGNDYKDYVHLCVMAVSLVAAWSWEHCFHTAINIIAEQYQVGYGGLVPKLVLAFGVPMVLLPGYLWYLKPVVVSIEEEHHREHPRHSWTQKIISRTNTNASTLRGESEPSQSDILGSTQIIDTTPFAAGSGSEGPP